MFHGVTVLNGALESERVYLTEVFDDALVSSSNSGRLVPDFKMTGDELIFTRLFDLHLRHEIEQRLPLLQLVNARTALVRVGSRARLRDLPSDLSSGGAFFRVGTPAEPDQCAVMTADGSTTEVQVQIGDVVFFVPGTDVVFGSGGNYFILVGNNRVAGHAS
ncbi:MAG TPA: hypothetical protein VMD08_06480 [Candidatus Baltobacteraceae bacterium]|nr:hypothetical protein [Candidatus Baltobacteraceae bacterium]